jgi:hypothetical protein
MANVENNQIKRNKLVFLITKTKRVEKWSAMEDKLLMIVAGNYGYRNWKAISGHFPGRTSIQCSARYKRIMPGFNKGLWSQREDSALLRLIKLHGKDWSTLSKYMGNRTGKQIRDRYLNTLDPDLARIKFTDEEDQKILELYLKYGSKWTTISKCLKGRSGDMVKNRFYSVIKNRLKALSPLPTTNLGEKDKPWDNSHIIEDYNMALNRTKDEGLNVNRDLGFTNDTNLTR